MNLFIIRNKYLSKNLYLLWKIKSEIELISEINHVEIKTIFDMINRNYKLYAFYNICEA